MEKKRVYYGGRRRTGLHYHGTSTMMVYALCDPRDGKVRYIGITDNLLARYNQHLRLNGPNTRKQDWLREVLDTHMLPVMHTLEVVAKDGDARERELAWIQAYVAAGADLLNHDRMPQPAGEEAEADEQLAFLLF